MATCPNRNATEYKALLEVYKTNIATDNIINSWQKLNKTDLMPDLQEATEFVKTQQGTLRAEQLDFAVKILNNLNRIGLVTKFQDYYIVNNSTKGSVNYNTALLDNNINKIKRYLEFNGIPSEIFFLKDLGQSGVMIAIYDAQITKNIMDLAKLKNKTNAPDILMHLQKMFPQIQIEIMNEKDAKAYYDILDENQKAKISFDDVKSFYVNGKSILIQERVNVETAIEEVLHPFVDALKEDNNKLYKSLLKDAKNNYPELQALVYETYTNEKGFRESDRENELITKALSKHFKNEYETNPTKTFLERVKEFINWFFNIITDLHNYLTGTNIKSTNTIKPGVEELFDSNPELANQVYEALGFKKSNLKLDFNIDETDDINIKALSNNKVIGNILLQKKGNNYFVRIVNSSYENQGVATELYKEAIKYATERNGILKPDLASASEVLSIYKKLEKEGLFKIDSISEKWEDGRYVIEGKSTGVLPKKEITSQQKQQALQLYSQYLDTIFPDSKVKDIVYHASLKNITKFYENQHFGTLNQAELRSLRKADEEDDYENIKIYS
jgi:hypothetical protein